MPPLTLLNRPNPCPQHYLANDQKLKRFVPLLQGSLVYPAIFDARRTLLSLPPIINGAHSAVRHRGARAGWRVHAMPGAWLTHSTRSGIASPRPGSGHRSTHPNDSTDAPTQWFTRLSLQITLETRDVLIECTATDLTKAKVVLNTVACMFAEYCEVPFEVEPVEVVNSFGETNGEGQSCPLYPQGTFRTERILADRHPVALALDPDPMFRQRSLTTPPH